jgi:hypothetical protein
VQHAAATGTGTGLRRHIVRLPAAIAARLLRQPEYGIHLQALWQAVSDKQHGHLALQCIDGSREVLGRRAVERTGGFIKD